MSYKKNTIRRALIGHLAKVSAQFQKDYNLGVGTHYRAGYSDPQEEIRNILELLQDFK